MKWLTIRLREQRANDNAELVTVTETDGVVYIGRYDWQRGIYYGPTSQGY